MSSPWRSIPSSKRDSTYCGVSFFVNYFWSLSEFKLCEKLVISIYSCIFLKGVQHERKTFRQDRHYYRRKRRDRLGKCAGIGWRRCQSCDHCAKAGTTQGVGNTGCKGGRKSCQRGRRCKGREDRHRF